MSDNQPFTQHCIYTILHSRKLDEAFNHDGRGEVTENTVWVSGRKMLIDAEKDGMRVPIIFAGAEADSPKGLLYYAVLRDVLTDEVNQTTTYKFSDLTPIPDNPPLSILRKRNGGKPLADKYQRPYALCHTPSFIR